MQHELKTTLAQAVDSILCIQEIVLVLELVQNLFPEEPLEDWQRQAYWLVDQCRTSLDCHVDLNKTPLLQGLNAVAKFSANECPDQTENACPMVRIELIRGQSNE